MPSPAASALQTTNSTLTFAVGYGASAGFANLTGQAMTASLNGPAPAGSNAAAIFDLAPFTFPAIEPTNGGVIFGSIALTSEQAFNLLAGPGLPRDRDGNQPRR